MSFARATGGWCSLQSMIYVTEAFQGRLVGLDIVIHEARFRGALSAAAEICLTQQGERDPSST